MSRSYVQHIWSKKVHIVRTSSDSTLLTQCGRWYPKSMSFVIDLDGERTKDEDDVCLECRRNAAALAGKSVYQKPILRRGMSKSAARKMKPLLAKHVELSKLDAWNKAAQDSNK